MFTILLFTAFISGVLETRADSGIIATNSAHVVVVGHPGATRAFTPQSAPIREIIRTGITSFTGKKTATSAWQSLISTQDVVGLKVHSAPGRTSGTRPAVVAAIIESLLDAGVPPSQIVIWDRRNVDLRLAGFFELAEKYGVTAAGAVDEGFDSAAFYETALLGKLVFSDNDFGRKGEGIGRKSYVSKLLTHKITKIVNITPLLNHNYAGVSGALYGLAMASVDNILRFEDPQRLATAIPEIYALPEISDRVVLNVVDALICQYQGEEQTRLHDSTALNEIWFSNDPVASDVLALNELERQKGNINKTPGKQIYTNAELMDLGTADPNKIKIERVELKPEK